MVSAINFHIDPAVTPKEINRHFVIRWRYADEPNSSFDRLIGGGKFEQKFGKHYTEKFFEKAMRSDETKAVFKIRGKYVITFAAR